MMIVVNNLSIGDEVWCVETHHNFIKRKRLTFTDDEGKEWERYDMPKITYSIDKKTLVGKVVAVISGTINKNDSDFDNEYHFQYEDGLVHNHYSFLVGPHTEEDWFASEADAIAQKESYEAEQKIK